jgi:hypothetical protein
MDVDPTYDVLIEDLDVTRAYNALFASKGLEVIQPEDLTQSFLTGDAFPKNETQSFYCDFSE